VLELPSSRAILATARPSCFTSMRVGVPFSASHKLDRRIASWKKKTTDKYWLPTVEPFTLHTDQPVRA